MILLPNIKLIPKLFLNSRALNQIFIHGSNYVRHTKPVQTCLQLNRRNASGRLLPYELDTTAYKDILLFKYENNRFYRFLNLFALSQFIIWTYLSEFSYSSLRDVSLEEAEKQLRASLPPESQDQKLAWWRRFNLGENKFRYGLTLMCFTLGTTIMVTITMVTRRTVKYLTLLQGGKQVQMVCYAPWWLPSRPIITSVENFNCQRARSHSTLPIRVKGYRFYFLLDKSGTYTNTKLFDLTAGLKRTWR